VSRKVPLTLLLVFLGLLLGVPFWLKPATEVVRSSRELIIVSPHWDGIRYEFDRAFREHWKAKTGEIVKIRWLDVGGGSDALKFVLAQFKDKPNGIGIDMFWGGGVDPFELMREKGILSAAPVPEELLRRIPERLFGHFLRAPDLSWYGTALSGFGIVYNKKVAQLLRFPAPASWEDLGRSEIFSYVGTGDPSNSSTSHTMYEFILQGYGFEKGMEVITRMAANARSFDKHSSEVSRQVALGEIAYGLSIDFYAGAAIAEAGSDKLGFVYPDRLTVVNPDPIAILNGAPSRDLADAFLVWLLSEDAQAMWLLPKGTEGGPAKFDLMRIPILPDLMEKYRDRTALTFNPFTMKETLEFKQDVGSKRWTILNDFLTAALIDTHTDLVRAWDAIRMRPEEERAAWTRELTAPLISETEIFTLAGTTWKDSAVRNDTRTEWTRRYRERYRTLAARAGKGGAG